MYSNGFLHLVTYECCVLGIAYEKNTIRWNCSVSDGAAEAIYILYL